MTDANQSDAVVVLLELAERCERAEGPDRELDAAIALHVLASLGCVAPYTPAEALVNIPNLCVEYTGSFDIAMELVPEGWAIESLSYWPASPEGADEQRKPQASARLIGTSLERFGRRMIWGHGSKDGRVDAEGAAPALALCAAALRALAYKPEPSAGGGKG